MSDKELNEMIDWCRKKISNLPYNYSGKRKEGYKDAMLQVMSYLHSKKGSEECWRADRLELKHEFKQEETHSNET